jgi:uncharacterized protein (DUF4415 family)
MSGKNASSDARGRTDWKRLAALSDQEIETLADQDKDNPATTETDWAEAVTFAPLRKTTINARFDADVVAWFKAQGPGYQPRMNAVLRHYMEVQKNVAKR